MSGSNPEAGILYILVGLIAGVLVLAVIVAAVVLRVLS